jgi:hypothetical protein
MDVGQEIEFRSEEAGNRISRSPLKGSLDVEPGPPMVCF